MAHKYFGLNDLREMFLKFFETKNHLRLPSFSLIPQNDKSLLLINSGMAPMKPYFKGEVEPPRRRVCTCINKVEKYTAVVHILTVDGDNKVADFSLGVC